MGGSSSNGSTSSYGSSSSGGISAWGVFDGTGSGNDVSLTPHASENIESIVRVDIGIYQITMANPMPSSNYSVVASCNPWGYYGAYAGVLHQYSETTTQYNATNKTFYIEVRNATTNRNENSSKISFHVVGAGSIGSSSSNSSPDDGSRIAPTIRKLIENFKQNNLDIELPEGIIVNWDNKDTILPLMSADKNYIWYGETIENVVVLKRFKNQKTKNNFGVSNNWGPVGDKEISDWDKSASLKDYIDSNKIK